MAGIDAVKLRLFPNIFSVLQVTNTKTQVCVFDERYIVNDLK